MEGQLICRGCNKRIVIKHDCKSKEPYTVTIYEIEKKG